MGKTKAPLIELILAVGGVAAALWGITLFNEYLLMTLPLAWRMALMPVTQWALFLAPGLLMLRGKENIRSLGFSEENVLRQLLLGLLLALGMSAIFTVLPILLGFRDVVGSASYTQAWQFAYQFLHMVLGVALAEELAFRGYLFHKLLELWPSRWFAIIVSSVLFGLLHVFNGNVMQVVVTALLGLLYCVFREKIRGCTLLSLILAHGLYDGLITLWAALL